VQRTWYLHAIAVTVRAILCGLLSGGLIIALADTSDAAKGRGKSRRPSGYYYNSPTTASERQLRNQRAYERGEYYEHDSNALPFGSRAWWEQKMREGADER
jgi:hypothetical protein